MVADIGIDFTTGDIGTQYFIEDVVDEEAFKQSLLMRLVIEKGSFIYDSTIGSNLHLVKKNVPTIKNDIEPIIQDAWMPYFITKEISSFTVEDVSFSNNTLNFRINVVLPSSRIITITR